MRGSAVFRTGVAPGGALAPGWVKNELWRKARTVPSLDLRFADDKSLVDATTGASLVTFTRASSGTFVGSDGVLRSAVTNLLTFSEDQSNVAWAKYGSSITVNATTGPFGGNTASKVVEDLSTGGHGFYQSATVVSGLSYVWSGYFKSAERSIFQLKCQAIGNVYLAEINLSNLTAITRLGSGTTTITNVGNGWYRVASVATSTAGGSGYWEALLCSAANTGSYTGDGTSGIYVWGAQLEQSSTVGEYIPTTSVINSAPRFDHNPTSGESLGLLVEEARTNLLLNSATLSTQSVTVAAAANTLSFYGTGTVTLTGVSTAGPLVGTGVNNRVSLTFTPTVGVLILTVSGSVTNAQLEAGAFPTSYIPTTTAAATRSADVASITGTAFTSFYNQTEGTVFGQFLRTASTNTQQGRVFSFNDGTNTNTLEIYQTSASNPSAQITATTLQATWTPSGFTVGTSIKEVLGYRLNNSNASFNGSTETLDTVCNIPTVIQARIGDRQDGVRTLNGTILRLTYWPVRLPDATLQSITQ